MHTCTDRPVRTHGATTPDAQTGPHDPTTGAARDRRDHPTTAEIEALIPHRWPFLLVDRIVEYDAEAKRIVGIKGVTAIEWFFQGHFPALPVMPGVLQVEALAQTMAVYVAKQPGFGDRIGLFAGIDECRFKRIVDARATRSASRSRWRSSAGGSGAAGASPASTARSPARRRSASSSRAKACSDDAGSPSCPTSTATSSRSRPSARRSAREKPDLVAIAGDLVLNGPDPAGHGRPAARDGGRRRGHRQRQHGHRGRRLRLRGGLSVDGRRRPRGVPGRGRMGARRARRRAARLAAPAARRSAASGPTTGR